MVNIALIGAGAISDIYLTNIRDMFWDVRVLGVCDVARGRAERAAAEYGIARIYDTLEQALADADVQLVLNLTRPVDHFEVTKAARVQRPGPACSIDSRRSGYTCEWYPGF